MSAIQFIPSSSQVKPEAIEAVESAPGPDTSALPVNLSSPRYTVQLAGNPHVPSDGYHVVEDLGADVWPAAARYSVVSWHKWFSEAEAEARRLESASEVEEFIPEDAPADVDPDWLDVLAADLDWWRSRSTWRRDGEHNHHDDGPTLHDCDDERCQEFADLLEVDDYFRRRPNAVDDTDMPHYRSY